MIIPNNFKSWDDIALLIQEMAAPYIPDLLPGIAASLQPMEDYATSELSSHEIKATPSADIFTNNGDKAVITSDTYSYSPKVTQSDIYSNNVNTFNVAMIRNDFPILSKKIEGKQLVWFDNGATTQKPSQVIDRLSYFYENENSNVHRGAHPLAEKSTQVYENARKTVANFINAPSDNNIVFVRGTTEAINLVASSFGEANIQAGDEIIISHMEHHANIVPWQLLCQKTGAILNVIPVDDNGDLIMDIYEKLLNERTKLVAVTQVSNVLGTVNPTKQIVAMAHRYGAKVLIDGAQSVAHMPTNVSELDADFFVFSGHKIFAPTGIGVLYGKEELLNTMPPYQSGGNMIADVSFEKTLYQKSPARFEAGTGNIADAVALGAALNYVSSAGIERIHQYEQQLLEYGTNALSSINKLRILGNPSDKAAVFSFIIDGVSDLAIRDALNKEGIAVRIGHHCAQPIHRRFGLEQSVRAAMAFYNTKEEIDRLVDVLKTL